jgi:NADH:ubiquinone oxidoreductase subunit E
MCGSEDGQCCCGHAGDQANEPCDNRLGAIIADWKGKPGALIPVLQETQRQFGYLSSTSLQRISEELGEPYNKVFGVVTFYSFFSMVPRGKYLVRVCMGTACYIRGAQQVLESFETRLNIKVGQTTRDRLFTLEVARCFGACGLAPAVSINDKVYKNVAPSRVKSIVDSYCNSARGKNKKVAA